MREKRSVNRSECPLFGSRARKLADMRRKKRQEAKNEGSLRKRAEREGRPLGDERRGKCLQKNATNLPEAKKEGLRRKKELKKKETFFLGPSPM